MVESKTFFSYTEGKFLIIFLKDLSYVQDYLQYR